MAFNWHTFRTRTLTAAVFIAIMLTGLLWNQWSFLILFSVIHFGCWWEYFGLVEKIYNKSINSAIKYFFCFCGYMLLLAVGYNNVSFDFIITIANIPLSIKWVVIVLAFALIAVFLAQNKQLPDKMKWVILFGFVYISFSCGLMIRLYQGETVDIHIYDTMFVLPGNFFPLTIILCIWVNDTMAYIVGSLIGKTPLTKISPKKTWEGTIGGIVLCIIVMSFLFPLIIVGTTVYLLGIIIAIIAGIASITGTFGDLFESKLKRMANVKDSGQIMPGHGGFLDRFDSLLFAVPAVWIFITLFS